MFNYIVTFSLLVSCTAMPGHDGAADGTCKSLNGSPMASPGASSHAGHGHHRQLRLLHGGEG